MAANRIVIMAVMTEAKMVELEQPCAILKEVLVWVLVWVGPAA